MLSFYDVAWIFDFRTGHLIVNNQLVCSSLRKTILIVSQYQVLVSYKPRKTIKLRLFFSGRQRCLIFLIMQCSWISTFSQLQSQHSFICWRLVPSYRLWVSMSNYFCYSFLSNAGYSVFVHIHNTTSRITPSPQGKKIIKHSLQFSHQ